MKKIKITELPLAQADAGFSTIAVDDNNKSSRIKMGDIALCNPIVRAISEKGALTTDVKTEHKAQSVKITIPAVMSDGSTKDISITIGAASLKAGLMLPEQVNAIKTIGEKADRSELSNIIGEPTEEELADISPTLVSEALRKVPQTLTTEEQAQVKKNLGISKIELFNDIFNQTCVTFPKEGTYWRTVIGGYDPENAPDAEHPYRLRDVWMTYGEAVAVLAAGRPVPGARGQYTNNTDIRTNLPAPGLSGIDAQFYPFYYCVNLEVANADNMVFRNGIYGCTKLHTVNNLDDVYADNVEACASATLVNLTIKRLTKSVNLRRNPLISRESLEQITANAANTSPITITVHSDVYTKLTDTANTEWHQVLLDAAAKNITFATV